MDTNREIRDQGGEHVHWRKGDRAHRHDLGDDQQGRCEEDENANEQSETAAIGTRRGRHPIERGGYSSESDHRS